jgi:hypothetical protein
VIAWVNKRQDVFPVFKERLSKPYLDALNADPESGYGADAILSTVENAGTKYHTVDTFYRREHIRGTLKGYRPSWKRSQSGSRHDGGGRSMVGPIMRRHSDVG